jgi:hypothetical protein
MRTPSRSFKAELDSYTSWITPDREELANHWKYRLVMEFLGQWRKHPDVERIWQDISRSLPPEIPAGVFIGAVVLERVKLEEVSQLLPELPATIATTKADIKRHIAADQFDIASAKVNALKNLIPARSAFSRKSGKAAEGRFMAFLQAFFEEKCGRPFSKHVATLTDIAFGGEHSTDDARDAARRPRRRR